MAIVQISRITNRKGLTENLPQLAGAELGWAIDSRRLFIGNGTIQEGAPVIGNTEILTEFSDITTTSDYTYQDVIVGYPAQTGPSSTNPVIRTIQTKLDDQASVRDFGAVGDGVTDDTQAINRALFELYCRETNTEIRRSLFFPAGTYLVSDSIKIPPYARLIGEGATSSVITMSSTASAPYVGRYADSLQQIGVNIGNNGATPPQDIEICNMGFAANRDMDLFLVEDGVNSWFDGVAFIGNVSQSRIENSGSVLLPAIAAVRFASTGSLIVSNIVFDKCTFRNITSAFNNTQQTQGVNITNSFFTVLRNGIFLDTGATTGFRIIHNVFDVIYAEGILINNVNLVLSAYNVFYNVGRSIGSTSATSPIIQFGNDLNLSVNDLFERNDSDAFLQPRVKILSTGSSTGGSQITTGRYTRTNGRTVTLTDNISSPSTIFDLNSDNIRGCVMDYTITRANTARTGRLTIVLGTSDESTQTTAYFDDYAENFDTGVTLQVTDLGAQVLVQYTTTSTGQSGTLLYSLSYLA